MIELTLVIISLLVFIYLRERELQTLLRSVPEKIDLSLKEERDRIDKAIEKINLSLMTERNRADKVLLSYLKHIQTLEKMLQPKPPKQTKSFDLLEKTIENEIDKKEEGSEPITEQNIDKIISSGPKIIFETPEDDSTIIDGQA